MLHDGFEVRSADTSDVASLAELEREARAAVADARGGRRWLQENPPVPDWSDAIATDRVVVASVDGVVVGFLHMAGPDGFGVAAVRAVYVHPEAREVGFGDLLLADAMAWARDRGAVAVEADALPGDRETKNLYERAGVTARKIVLYAPLDD